MMGGGGGGGKGGKQDPAKKVRVDNLPPGFQWQALKDCMREAGSVEFCNVSDGVGEVRYNTAEEAQYAVEMFNGAMLDGATPISVSHWGGAAGGGMAGGGMMGGGMMGGGMMGGGMMG